MLVLAIILIIILASIVIAFLYLRKDTHYVTRFIIENPNRTSICLIRNDKIVLAHDEDKLMPLASTVKIIIALEYANQVSKNVISKDELVDLHELGKFYLPNTDAGAHKSWLSDLEQRKLIQENGVTMEEVAKGMIKFSSNANAEYLIGRLGKENIDSFIKNENLNHSPIFPFVSSLIVSSTSPALSTEGLISESWKVHEELKKGNGELIRTFTIPKLAVQKTWSDRLPASTTKEYCFLMNKINTDKLADNKISHHAKEILGWPPINKDILSSFGIKGGTTAFVLTEALYASDAFGNSTAAALFFNDLKDWEKIIIGWNLSRFELKVLFDEKFRNVVCEKISALNK